MQSRFLLRPSRKVNDLILGVFGRAQSLYPDVRLYGFHVAANHMHSGLAAKNVQQKSAFMNFVNGNIAREIGKLHDWREGFWGRRYTEIAIDDDQSFIRRMRYILSHGCKEFLVRRPQDWPGIHCVDALTKGEVLKGTWFNRSAFYKDEQRGKDCQLGDYSEVYEVKLTPIPCLEGLSVKEQQAFYRKMCADIQEDTRRRCIDRGYPVLGARAIKKENPHFRPSKTKKSPAPWCHAKNMKRVKQFKREYKNFVARYREAVSNLLLGKKDVEFPEGCFLPSLNRMPVGRVLSVAPG